MVKWSYKYNQCEFIGQVVSLTIVAFYIIILNNHPNIKRNDKLIIRSLEGSL
jgi:hypothetical protein